MSDKLIEKSIFSALSDIPGQWRKIALVVGSVVSAMGRGLTSEEDSHEMVARRIESLVSEGRLLARGNIKNWRFSEVRLPD